MRRFAVSTTALALPALWLLQACTSREVVGVVVRAVAVQPPATVVLEGDSVQLSAFVLDDGGDVLQAAVVEWSAEPPSLVSVSPSGVVRGLSPGPADVTATFAGVSGTARVMVIAVAPAEFGVTESGGATQVAETGSTDEILVALLTQPQSNVVIEVTSDDPGEATVSPPTLTFGPSNWNVAQTVIVSGVNDDLVDGDQVTGVTFVVSPDASDEAFHTATPKVVDVTTVDDDFAGGAPGFVVSEGGDTTIVSERGGTDAFTVVLTARPSSNVVLRVSSADLGEVTVAPTTVTFAPAVWNIPQTVTVTGVDDLSGDGDQVTVITIAVDPSSDPEFAGLPSQSITATTVDDDLIGFTLGETSGTTVNETGDLTDAIAVHLNSVPVGTVVLSVTSADPGEATVSPATLMFTATNGGQPQAVVVRGVNDVVVDGDAVTLVAVAVDHASTLDSAYDTVVARTVNVTTLDDDTPDFTVTETSGSTSVDESGTTDVFTVVLDAQPLSNVVLAVASGDAGEVVAQPATLTFGPADWSTAKTVTVTGVDDGVADGDQVTTVSISVHDASSDDAWDAVADQAVSVMTRELRGSGFAVTETGDATSVQESGTTDVFTIVLDAAPSSTVVLTVTSQDTGEVVVDSATLTFTPANWSTPKSVTVRGVDDSVEDGDQLTLVTVAVGPGSDAAFLGLGPKTVSVTTRDDDVAGFTVTESGGTTSVDERGTTDTFLVALDTPPLASVILTVTNPDPSEVTTDSATLTFTPSTWNVPKTVTVRGIDDSISDGPQVTAVTIAVGAGSDPAYLGSSPRTVNVTTRDDDVAGFTVTETGGGSSVDESGTTDALLVVLNAPPTAAVLLRVVSADLSEVVVDSATLTFTPTDWSTPKAVTLTGVDDIIVDGARVTTVTISVATGSDDAFIGLPPRTVTVTTTDDDVADFAIDRDSAVVSEGRTTATFHVVLTRRPLSSVTLTVTSPDVGEVTVSPATVTFSPGKWNEPKRVTVTGVDDALADGNQITLVVVAVVDASSDDAFDAVPDKALSVTTLDNEVAGFTVLQSGGSTAVSESGTSDAFTVVLDRQPTADVVFTVTSADSGEVVVSIPGLTFTTANWATPQMVTVTGVADGLDDGAQSVSVTVAVDPGASAAPFAGLAPRVIQVTNADID